MKILSDKKRLGLFLAMLVVLGWVLAACGDENKDKLATGDVKTEPVVLSNVKSLLLDLPGGELITQGGGGSGVSGTIEYNVTELKPTFDGSGTADPKIKQSSGGKSLPGKELVNRWNLKLGSASPLDFSFNLGSGNATTSTGDLQFSKYNARISNGDLTVNLDQPQESLSQFNVQIDNGNLTVKNCYYLGKTTMSMKVGNGKINLDFSAGIKSTYYLIAGVGNGDITFTVPKGLGVKLVAIITTGGFSAPGYTRQGAQTIYTNEEWDKGGPTLTLDLRVSNGSIKANVV